MIILNFGYINLLMKTAVFKLNTIYVCIFAAKLLIFFNLFVIIRKKSHFFILSLSPNKEKLA